MVTPRRISITSAVQRQSGHSQDTRIPSGLGQRHCQAGMWFLGLAIAYAMRVNLSVAVVAMTAQQNKNTMVLNWDLSEQSFALSAFFLGYMLLNIPGGHLSRVFGPKYLLFGAVLVSSVMTLLGPYIAQDFSWAFFCSSRIAVGLSQGFCYPCINTLMSKWAPLQEGNRLVACVYVGGQFGTTVTLLVAGYLAASPWGWPSIFYSTGLCGVLWAAVWLFVGADSPDSHPSISDTERDYIKASLSSSSDLSKVMPTPWKQIATSRPMWALILVHMGQNWGYTVLFTMLPNFLSDILHFNIGAAGLVSSLIYLLMCVLTFIFSWMTDYCIGKRLLPLNVVRKSSNSLAHWGAAVALALLLFTASSNSATITLMTIALSLNSGTYIGFYSNHLDLAPNFAGLLMGITCAFSNITAVIGPIVTGLVVTDETNREEWIIAFLICAAIYFVGNLIFVIFGSTEVQPWNAPIIEEKKCTEITQYAEYITSI